MGLVNTVVPLARLEEETLVWCREMMRNSPTALRQVRAARLMLTRSLAVLDGRLPFSARQCSCRVLKSALNACEDGHMGLQQLGGDATLLFYQGEEGNEGREAYVEKRAPDFSKFKRLP